MAVYGAQFLRSGLDPFAVMREAMVDAEPGLERGQGRFTVLFPRLTWPMVAAYPPPPSVSTGSWPAIAGRADCPEGSPSAHYLDGRTEEGSPNRWVRRSRCDEGNSNMPAGRRSSDRSKWQVPTGRDPSAPFT